MPTQNPPLPKEIRAFSATELSQNIKRSSLSDNERLHMMELQDVNQQITMRPLVAIFFGALLILQNWVVFFLVGWSLENGMLPDLQLIFAVLIAGSLVQTYKISQLIVNKLFEAIDYADKQNRFKGQ